MPQRGQNVSAGRIKQMGKVGYWRSLTMDINAQAKIKELEAAQGKILKVCEPCGQEGIAEIEKLEQRIKELTEALEMLSGHDDRFVRETAQAALGGKE
jgi:hypothetical protein